MSTLKVNAIRQTTATSDAVTLASDGTCTVKATNKSNRNLIINGAMQVAQRGTSSTTSNSYVCDRFNLSYNGQDEAPTFTQGAVASGTTPYNLGFRNCLKVTNGNQTSGAGATDYIQLKYVPEAQDIATSGWNYKSASSYVTLSFWIKSSVAQAFSGSIWSRDGTQKNYKFNTPSLSADTWTKVTKTIPGHSDLSFDNDNGIGAWIFLYPFIGTDYTTADSDTETWIAHSGGAYANDMTSTWWTTNDATFELTGVQLEVGDVATDFEHRSYGDELARCQRYFFQATEIGSTSDVSNNPVCMGMYMTSTDVRGIIYFPVEMRTAPTLSSNDNTSSYYIQRDGSADMFNDLVMYQATTHRCTVRNHADVSGTAGHAGVIAQETGDSNLNFSAEL